jgi:hypothetical protein
MRRYIERMQEERTPHERRQFALRVAGGVTAVLFVGWLATLGIRFSTVSTEIAEQGQSPQAASIGSLIPVEDPNTLYVASTTLR